MTFGKLVIEPFDDSDAAVETATDASMETSRNSPSGGKALDLLLLAVALLLAAGGITLFVFAGS